LDGKMGVLNDVLKGKVVDVLCMRFG